MSGYYWLELQRGVIAGLAVSSGSNITAVLVINTMCWTDQANTFQMWKRLPVFAACRSRERQGA